MLRRIQNGIYHFRREDQHIEGRTGMHNPVACRMSETIPQTREAGRNDFAKW